MIHALLLAPALVALQADPWSDAVATLEAKLKAQPGIGAVVLVERVDARTIRLRIKSAGAGFKQVEALSREAGGAYDIKASTPQMMDTFETTTLMPAEAVSLLVFIHGEMFSPKVVVPIPKAGAKAEPAYILMGVRTK
jgi:hypothetical protein